MHSSSSLAKSMHAKRIHILITIVNTTGKFGNLITMTSARELNAPIVIDATVEFALLGLALTQTMP